MMYLENIKLLNFRCYKNFYSSFDKGINIIVGNNAVGKTSLVEAINVLCVCKSFKTYFDPELINKDENFYSVLGNISCGNNKKEIINIYYDEKGKKVFKNSKKFGSLSQYVGELRSVSFSPEDIKLIIDDSRYRRRLLDVYIGQIDKKYLNNLIRYKKLLKERNELLKNIDIKNINNNLIDVYDDELIQAGIYIVNKRNWLINQINNYLNDKINMISLGDERGQIVYKPNVNVDNYRLKMCNSLNLDIKTGFTNIGPHRDDFDMLTNNENTSLYGSQGQKKTILLGIKLSLVEIMNCYGENTIIIMDDVLSDLDNIRQNELFRSFNNYNQIFITTTSLLGLSDEIIKKSKIININKAGE